MPWNWGNFPNVVHTRSAGRPLMCVTSCGLRAKDKVVCQVCPERRRALGTTPKCQEAGTARLAVSWSEPHSGHEAGVGPKLPRKPLGRLGSLRFPEPLPLLVLQHQAAASGGSSQGTGAPPGGHEARYVCSEVLSRFSSPPGCALFGVRGAHRKLGVCPFLSRSPPARLGLGRLAGAGRGCWLLPES